MPRKFPWLIFFIISFSTSSLGLLFIPYQEIRHLDPGYPIEEHNFSLNSNTINMVVFPWRSFNQEIYLNISVFNATSSIQIIDQFEFASYYRGESYDTYWGVNNLTVYENTIQITPSSQGYILF